MLSRIYMLWQFQITLLAILKFLVGLCQDNFRSWWHHSRKKHLRTK